jgi:hypothetical protein
VQQRPEFDANFDQVTAYLRRATEAVKEGDGKGFGDVCNGIKALGEKHLCDGEEFTEGT